MGQLAKDYGDREPVKNRQILWDDWLARFDEADQAVILGWVHAPDASLRSIANLIFEATGQRWTPNTIGKQRQADG